MFRQSCRKSFASLGLIWAFCVYGMAETADLPSVMDLHRTHIEANGGLANIQALTSLVTYGVITDANGNGLDFKIYKKRPGLTRMQIDGPQGEILKVFDGERAFEIVSRMGERDRVVDLGAEETESMRLNSTMDGPFFQLRGRPEWLEVVAKVSVEGRQAYEIKINEAANVPYERIWVDVEHCQEMKLSRRIQGEDEEEFTEEIYFSDFDQVNGVWFAKMSRYERGGSVVQSVRIDRVRANVGIFDSLFQRPKP